MEYFRTWVTPPRAGGFPSFLVPRRAVVATVCVATMLIVMGAFAIMARAEDWPTYQRDASRSGVASASLEVPLRETWVWRSPMPPQMAWDAPAKRDTYNKVENLRNRADFDRVFHTVIAHGAVYFGSSASDQIVCLDARTGDERWSFFTEGPVRLAPTIHKTLVLCGSDDGHVYALNAMDGHLQWKVRIGPRDERLPGNSRLISRWPVRTGIVVRDEIAYVAAGMFPYEGVHVVALQVDDGTEVWRSTTPQLPAQGYILASNTRLYVPTGRNNPIVFERETGQLLRVVEGAGGTYCLLTGDTLVFGPGKTGELSLVEPDQRDQLATFRGNHMIVTPAMSYIQADDELTSLDRTRYLGLARDRRQAIAHRDELQKDLNEQSVLDKSKRMAQIAELTSHIAQLEQQMSDCQQWSVACSYPHAMILAGDALVVGGHGEVAAFRTSDGVRIWSAPVDGNAHGLAVASGQLFVSTDRGSIHAFGHAGQSLLEQQSDKNGDDGREATARVATLPATGSGPVVAQPSANENMRPEVGPIVRMLDRSRAEILWQSPKDAITLDGAVVYHGSPGQLQRQATIERQGDWLRAVLDNLHAEAEYQFQLPPATSSGSEATPKIYTFDATQSYVPPTIVARRGAFETRPEQEAAARQILQLSDWRTGHAIVLGADDGHLAYELARQSNLRVTIVEPDAERADNVRRRLLSAGAYGARVDVHVAPLDKLPHVDYCANLVVSGTVSRDEPFRGNMDEALRVLRPAGGAAFLEHADLQAPRFRDELEGTGRWTHQYGEADNSSCSKDERVRGDMRVQWWGPPGPRPMPDRGGRNPSPLSVGGYLFTQGDRILFGQDAYNGTIFWSLMLPELRRSNIPRDSSNMAAATDALYVATAGKCLLIEPRTGMIKQVFAAVAPEKSEARWDWGYVGYIEDTLIGSSVREASAYTADHGEWYEDYDPSQVNKIVSPVIFARNRHTGDLEWSYEQGVVLNSTITIAQETVYFVESRGAAALAADSARQPHENLVDEQFLVALDRKTGRKRWEQPVDLSACDFMTYMAAGRDKLIISGTDRDKTFHHFAFDQTTGGLVWERHDSTAKTHHSGHLDHMVIIGDKLYSNLHVMDMHTGRDVEPPFAERRGCGVMAASNHMLMFRHHFHSLWDLESGKRWELPGIRSGCWLGIIPAGGLVLAPESSSGCSCTHALQTSVGFRPAP